MSKKFRLKKDLPDAKAGTILTLGGYGNDLYMYSGFLDNGQEASWYAKSTVENNPEWFEEIIDKPEWEIVKCLSYGGGSTHYYNKDKCLGADPKVSPCTIHSVKRLSDGEVFSVGDEVAYEPKQKIWWVIDNFHVRSNDNIMLARSKDNLQVEELNTVIKNKYPKPKEEEPTQESFSELMNKITDMWGEFKKRNQ